MMNIKKYLVFTLLSMSVLVACEKDKEQPGPDIKMSTEEKVIQSSINDTVTLSAISNNNAVLVQEWLVNGVVVSNSSIFKFVPPKSGVYNVVYSANNAIGSYSYEYTINVDVVVVPSGPSSNKYVTKLFEFLPAPGQNTNKSLGSITGAESLKGKLGTVSLGAWGGYIVMGFDHTVLNQAGKEDIAVYGNASAEFAEPGIVWVMQDENANGLPDDTWYEVKGSEFGKEGYVRNYEVTYTKPATGGPVSWRDNQGQTGVVALANKTFQAFPSTLTGNEYTIKGSLLPSSNINMTTPTYIKSMPFAFGYGDNTANGDKIDIANAIDKDGKAVVLVGIDFIKIQTGIQANLGWLGELSTEVTGIADLSLVN